LFVHSFLQKLENFKKRGFRFSSLVLAQSGVDLNELVAFEAAVRVRKLMFSVSV